MTTESKFTNEISEPFDPSDPEHVEIIRKLFPDISVLEGFHNPPMQVQFRAGMLVMRRMIAHYMSTLFEMSAISTQDQADLNQMVSTMWPSDPHFGEDPVTLKRFDFEELVTDYGTPQQKHHTPSVNREASVQAYVICKVLGFIE